MTPNAAPTAPVPRSFTEYLRSLGPGLIIVLTWLGAGSVGVRDPGGQQLPGGPAAAPRGRALVDQRRARYIGPEHRTRWWENAVMAVLFALAVFGAIQSVQVVLVVLRADP